MPMCSTCCCRWARAAWQLPQYGPLWANVQHDWRCASTLNPALTASFCPFGCWQILDDGRVTDAQVSPGPRQPAGCGRLAAG